MTFEEALISVWQQALVDNSKVVILDGESFPVLRTQGRYLRQVDFKFQGRELRGLEQNPNTKSEWAKLARSGKRVMQFLAGGRYIAVVFEGKITLYNQVRKASAEKKTSL